MSHYSAIIDWFARALDGSYDIHARSSNSIQLDKIEEYSIIIVLTTDYIHLNVVDDYFYQIKISHSDPNMFQIAKDWLEDLLPIKVNL